MPQFPFPEGDGFGGIAFHEVSCRRFVFVLGHDGDRYAEYGRLSGGGSLFEDGLSVTSASTRSTASPSSCPVPSLPCLPHRAEGSTNSLLYNLQRLSVSRVLPGGTMAGSACRAGIEVIFVAPRYTSQTCPHCNAIGTRQKHRFVCKNCGYRAHSDLNGGRNLQRLGCLLITQGLV